MAATITFDGREYIATRALPGLKPLEVQKGRYLGNGEAPTCSGEPKKVRVYKVVGVPFERAVFSEPEFGLMERWDEDGTIQ